MRKNGSVTVFFALLLVLLASVLFAFLEAARVSCLKAEAHLCTGQAADAVRASYQPELWKDYHLLFWQQSGTDVDRFADLYQLQKDMVEKNQAVNVSHNNFFFLPVHSRAITVEQYQLATDSGGLAFRNQAADWVKKTIAGDSIDLVWKVVTSAETSGRNRKWKMSWNNMAVNRKPVELYRESRIRRRQSFRPNQSCRIYRRIH